MPLPPLALRRPGLLPCIVLAVIPAIVVLVAFFAPLRTDAAFKYSGLATEADARLLSGEPTIDGNMGVTAQALGVRAALDVLAGRMPLWNSFEGLGQPLLGEMQSAALFPPTWLLVLPHGQAIEQAVLQFVAGLGTFLFLRRFGLAVTAALAGGLLFEVNGVFAWLRNAITNPVALLPWLFLAVELLRDGARGWARAGRIAAAAVLASAALYAGFPEEVYLYGLLLVVWALFRAASLSLARIRRFAADLALAGLGALALSAPGLVAFADFLRQAEVGGHVPGGFEISYDATTLLQYFVPYVYGTIFQSPVPIVRDVWEGTGGYIGFVPPVLACAAVLAPGRRAAKLVLLGWIALALGATHGAPVLYGAFHLLPLTDIAAVPRYLNTSWIFCFVVLAALFIDGAPAMAPRRLRLTLGAALGIALACLIAIVAADRPVMGELWAASAGHRKLFAVAAATTGGLSALIAGAAWMKRSRAAALSLAGVAVAEAVAWFALPYLSYPRHGRLDLALISFLREQTGRQRVLGVGTAALSPNYGSAIGVASLNYDDLPAPRLTAAYIRGRLDPYAGAISFWPIDGDLAPEERATRRDLVYARLDAYGDAGVKFVLSGEGFDRVAPYEVDAARRAGSLPLAPGGDVLLTGRISPDLALPASAVSVALEEEASGRLEAELCAGAGCASGRADLAGRGTTATIALDREVELRPGDAYTLRLARPAGEAPLALALHPVTGPDRGVAIHDAGGRAIDGAAPRVRFTDARLALAFSGRAAQVYRLRRVRDYLSAPGCSLAPETRDRLSASCAAPSRLLRLELAMEGWSATVDGRPAPVAMAEGAFQAVDLPAGESRVAFAYAPRGFGWASAAAALALAGVAVAGIGAAAGGLPRGGRRSGPGLDAGSAGAQGPASSEGRRA